MTSAPARSSLRAVRRLAVTKQHLAAKRPGRVTPARILATIRDLPYVQWDPVSVVAPSHLLSLWARLGPFRSADFDRLLWKQRRLLQHWIPFAGVVLAEDYPLYASLMRRYPESLSSSWGAQRNRARAFLRKHRDLRARVRADLRGGPLQLRQFLDHARTRRSGPDWAPSSAVAEMLWHLLMAGEVMVVGHEGNQNLWGLSDRFLPSWVPRKALTAKEADREAAQRALRGLGVATSREINRYFIRGCYSDLRTTLTELVADSSIRPVVVDGLPRGDEQYVHASDFELLEELGRGEFPSRVAVLPPFDNMVYDPARGKRLFGFDYVREQFLPPAKRRFGMWVLPILLGEQFLGRADARLDKEKRVLRVNAVFAERNAPEGSTVAASLREEFASLAGFVGADSVSFSAKVPGAWRSALR